MWIRVVLVIFALAIGTRSEPRRRFNLEIYESRCRNHTDLIQLYECDFYQVAPNFYGFNNRIILSKELLKQFEVRIFIDVQQKYAKVRARLIDIRLDGCKSLETIFDNVMLQTLVAELRRTSNFPFKCPLKAGSLYKFENFTISTAMLPPYTPDMNFTFSIEFFDNSVMFANQNIVGSIVSKRYSKSFLLSLISIEMRMECKEFISFL